MASLRQKRIDAMLIRGMSPRTQRSYLMVVTGLAKHFHRSADQLSEEELKALVLVLVKERHLTHAS